MSFRLLHEAEARVEFQEAVAAYEAQCPGRGVRFTLDVDKVMNAISVQPLRFSKASQNSRRARVLGWPYTICFAVNEAEREVRVIAVWHGARNPAVLRPRLR
jgi:plasmid stabilization system protein ParE